jgi:hypothetical protein
MIKLTPEGEKLIADIANRHQASVDAVKAMLEALLRGGGTMAQFNHPEFGGSGQWLSGGMTMVGDMFNNALKAKVDGLASELSGLIAGRQQQSGWLYAPSSQSQSSQWPGSQSQSQSSGSGGSQAAGGPSAFGSYFSQSGDWWPTDLGSPASVGSQNEMRYAYFPAANRLALYRGGRVEVLDTGEHIISGFGQQQGGGDSITLTSQLGTVPLSSLKRIDTREGAESAPASFPGTSPAAVPASTGGPSRQPADAASVLGLLQKLGELRDKGVLTEEEFAAKKTELLQRL